MRRAIPFFVFICVCGALPASGQVITPSIEVNVTSGPAPLAVSFNASGTRHSNSSINANRFHELLYLWNYDDPASGNWAPTGKSRNHMSGPLGAHVFEPAAFTGEDCDGKACVYKVRVTVRDEHGYEKTSDPIEITVYDPNSTGANGWGDAGETVCISRTTDHRGCPSAATKRGHQTGDLQTILKSEIDGNRFRRILFHAGQTWNLTARYTLDANGPGLIGAYGSGNFTVNFQAGTETWPLMIRGDDWRMQDFRLAGTNVGNFAAVISSDSQVKNWLLQRTVSDSRAVFETLVNMPMSRLPSGPDESIHRHIFLVDNNWSDLMAGSDHGGAFAYIGAWGLNILGNEFGDVNQGEHVIRIPTGEAVLISNNKLGPNEYGRSVLNLRDLPNSSSTCQRAVPRKPFCGREINRYVIQDNDLLCNWPSCIGAGMQTDAGAGVPSDPLGSENFIFERNFFREAPGGDMGSAAISLNTKYGPVTGFVIRNNIADMTGWTWATGFEGQPGVRIYNNTCYRSDVAVSGYANCVTPKSASECYNNVMYAPNWSGTIRWRQVESWGGTCATESNNFDNGLTGNITRKPFVSNNPASSLDYAPGAGSELIDSGKVVPGIFDDHSAHCRSGTPDVGAIEERGSATTCTVFGGGTGLPVAIGPPGKPILYP